jgi:hypothetical protein
MVMSRIKGRLRKNKSMENHFPVKEYTGYPHNQKWGLEVSIEPPFFAYLNS